jgi:N-methylhydantoinase A
MSGAGIVFGVDTGGTFTDIVGLDEAGRILVRKVDNQAADATRSIAEGVAGLVAEAGLDPARVGRMVHCTTILGNSVIERKGPACGLITTEGFRDVLELGRQHNPVLYDIFWKKTKPLIPRRRIVEVRERIGADGAVVEPIDAASLGAALAKLAALGVRSVAICLINACTNPAHEEAIAAEVRRFLPEVTISLSSRISPEWGEYERTSTTATDAFVKPTFATYLTALQREMAARDLRPDLFVMQSAGSIAPAAVAMDMPVHCLDSGPAAAVVAAAHIGRALGYPEVLTLEIGGTTAKSTLIEGGVPRRATETEIGTPLGSDGRVLRGGGFVLRMPVIDAAEVGAGGGSIARVDAGGALLVGPEGAGAFPGPASYGRGGTMPTVTDANLVLGYLSGAQKLGGTIELDTALARAAIEREIAKPLGIPVLDAAFAIRALANAIIARAVRTVSTERGRDLRGFALLAAGGGGPGHAAEIARALGISTVIIPPQAGVFAALGMLWAPPEQRAALAVKLRLSAADAAPALDGTLSRLLRQLDANAFAGERQVREEVDVRYVGQFHQLTVPVARLGGVPDLAAIREAFEAEHERSFGYRSPREGCEVATVRVLVGYPSAMQALALPEPSAVAPSGPAMRDVYFGAQLGMQRARVIGRAAVGDRPVQGPFVIPEYDTTVIVPPDFTLRREASGALVLERVQAGG